MFTYKEPIYTNALYAINLQEISEKEVVEDLRFDLAIEIFND